MPCAPPSGCGRGRLRVVPDRPRPSGARHAGGMTTTTSRTRSAGTLSRPARPARRRRRAPETTPRRAAAGGRHLARGRASPCCRSPRRRCSTPPTPPPRAMVVGVGFVVVAALEVVVGWGLYRRAARARPLPRLRRPGQPGWVCRAPRGRGRSPALAGRRRRGRVPGRLVAGPPRARRAPPGDDGRPVALPRGARSGGGGHRRRGHGSPAAAMWSAPCRCPTSFPGAGPLLPGVSRRAWCCWRGCPPCAVGRASATPGETVLDRRAARQHLRVEALVDALLPAL